MSKSLGKLTLVMAFKAELPTLLWQQPLVLRNMRIVASNTILPLDRCVNVGLLQLIFEV
jgi:hypothetical protein